MAHRVPKHNFTPPHNRVGRKGSKSIQEELDDEEAANTTWWDSWLRWQRSGENDYSSYWPSQEDVLTGVTKAIQDLENSNASN